MKKEGVIGLSLIGVLLLVVLFYFLFFSKGGICNDETLNNECSKIQPYFCSGGNLIEKSSVCGCNLSKIEGDKCISIYHSEPKNITLNYILRGERSKIDFVVYKKMYDYISGIPRYVDSNKNWTLLDFKLRLIDEPYQRELLLPLVLKIQSITKSKEDQARIAISIVQSIPFGSSNKTTKLGYSEVEYQRYPYEVLYDMEGICSEKAELLVFLLREIGYGAAFLYYPAENHEAVGVKCEIEKSNFNGYCFVETTAASIMTDDKTEYFGVVRQLNSTPMLIIASYGLFFENFYEYKDARTLATIREKNQKDTTMNLIESLQYKRLKKMYGLASFYNSYRF